MCGIFGWIGHVEDANAVAENSAKRLRHRGPDGHRIESWPSALLGHTRLKILDLSEEGSQPMTTPDSRVWSICNGEIYNHRELRMPLEKEGRVFRSQCDAEVIPHLFQDSGSEFVTALRGMFAIAVFDSLRRELWLYRDRFGIKPLFFAADSERLAFASEIGALRAHSWIDFSPRPQGLADFVGLRYNPAPESFFKGVKALEPGHWLRARTENGRLTWATGKYHSLQICLNQEIASSDVVSEAGRYLSSAVARQLQADVPLGAFLSGGIDSSLICVEAQRALSSQLRTFTVSFHDADYNEADPAEEVARYIDSHHLTITAGPEEMCWDNVRSLLLSAGQPFGDSSILAANAVCRHGRRHVVVALSGDGGDEGFAGYHAYRALKRIAALQERPRMQWLLFSLLAGPAAKLGVVSPELPARIGRFRAADDVDLVQAQFAAMSQEDVEGLCAFKVELPIRRFFERQWPQPLPKTDSRLEQLLGLATEVNIRLTLPNDFLAKVDIASMMESLEVRVPFLDEDLMDFALSLPMREKMNRKEGKLPLRALAAQVLPAAIARRAKHGFSVPLGKWFGANFKESLRRDLLDGGSPLRQVFRPKVYEPWVQSFVAGRQHPGMTRKGLDMRIFMLLAAHTFLGEALD